MSKKHKEIVSKIFEKSKIFDGQLYEQTVSYLIQEYDKKGQDFSVSSPYGQILQVLLELDKLQYFYLEDVANERNILTAYKEKSIHGLSRLTGHNPSRPVSARGEISLKIKPGIANSLKGSNVVINNATKLICKNNQLVYFIKLDSDKIYIPKNSSTVFYFELIEGENKTSEFYGNGLELQSFNVPTRFTQIENDLVKVFVNGQECKLQESLYDTKKNEYSCIVKTGINGGIDLYFGNRDYGYVPKIGEKIEVHYVLSNGQQGNINEISSNVVLEFLDSVSDGFGSELDYNEIFDISCTKKITMGANAESKELTKMLSNKNSRSLVLANPDNYLHFLSKFNQFSHIEAYNTFGDDYLDDDNVVYLFLLPDIRTKLQSNSEYFSTAINNFFLDEQDKNAVYSVINNSKRQFISSELVIIDPIITKYALNVFIRVFDDILSEDALKSEIVDGVSTYFLNNKRRDKIPRSDLIKIIEEIYGVDSVYVEFVSEQNETALRQGYYYKNIDYGNSEVQSLKLKQLSNDYGNISLNVNNTSNSIKTTEKITLKENENPNLGLDNFGDIVIGKNELPLLRGGFIDRNGVEYLDGINPDNLCALNIIILDSTKRK